MDSTFLEADQAAEATESYLKFERPVNSRVASEFIGVHYKTLERMSRQGEVPATKIGKEWIFCLSQLSIWLDGQMQSNLAPHP
jgi:hypothetical protein